MVMVPPGDAMAARVRLARLSYARRMDTLDAFKAAQRETWAHFAPLASITTAPAASWCDTPRSSRAIASWTWPAAQGSWRSGGAPWRARHRRWISRRSCWWWRGKCAAADVEIDFHEGGCERIPFDDAAFDVVVSQFGHIFAPRPEVAIGEMLRVLKKGGTIAFSTWPPEPFVGRMFPLPARYAPPPPLGVAPLPARGEPAVVSERLGAESATSGSTRHHDVRSLSPQQNAR